MATEEYIRTEAACSGDGRFLAISARTRIEIFDSNGESLHRIAHAPLDFGSCCCFDADGKLWCVQPPEERDGCDRLTIIDPESGEVLAEQPIRDENDNPADVGHFSLYPCPNGVDMLLNLACGQDGNFLVGYQALYLDDTHLLVETGFGRILLLNRPTMQPAGNISLPDFPLQGYDKRGKKTDDPAKAISYETGLSSLQSADPNRVLAVYNERHFRLLNLSEVLLNR